MDIVGIVGTRGNKPGRCCEQWEDKREVQPDQLEERKDSCTNDVDNGLKIDT